MQHPETEPSNQDVRTLLDLFRTGQLGEAEGRARDLIDSHPGISILHSILGATLAGQKKFDQAVASYDHALEIDPNDAEAHSNRGAALRELHKLDAAIASYRKALTCAPDYWIAHFNLGIALQELGQLVEAVASYEQAIVLNPRSTGAYYNLGNALRDLGKFEEAIASYLGALRIEPNHSEAYNNLGLAYKFLGKYEEAVASYQRAIEIEPNYAIAYANLSNAQRELGQVEEALASCKRALLIDPAFANAFFNLHGLLIDPADMGPAIDAMEKAVAFHPENIDFRFQLGLLHDYTGDRDKAVECFAHVENGSEQTKDRLDAWNYIKSSASSAPRIFGTSIAGFRIAFTAAANEGLVLEFGVRFGGTIRLIAGLTDQDVHGFDSFEGLPEAWHYGPKGSLSTRGVMPEVPKNVHLHRGWFEDTLPGFVETHKQPVRLMNIDCDIYSSTKTVLDILTTRVVPGTVIVFDEYIGNEQWREEEFKAFQEAVNQYGWKYEYLAFSMFTKQVVVRILD